MTNSKKNKTMKFLFPAVLVVPVLTGLIPCTANAQVDPGGKKPEAVAANTAATPVYTVDSDASGRRPYALFAQFPFQNAGSLNASSTAFTNNTSKVFVVTSLSVSANMLAADALMNCMVTISGTSATGGMPALSQQQMVLPAIYSGSAAGEAESYPGWTTSFPIVYSANAGILMYLMPAQKASVSCARGAAPAQTLGDGTKESVTATLTGHLEDVPAQ